MNSVCTHGLEGKEGFADADEGAVSGVKYNKAQQRRDLIRLFRDDKFHLGLLVISSPHGCCSLLEEVL